MNTVKILGHERPIKILLNSIKSNRLASSYLFVGPEGIGKGLVAKYIAQVLNCEENNSDACGICASCKKIENLNHPDVHWISADSSEFIKIDQIRRLLDEVNLRPFEARYKVFIILDAQKLTEEAANCLLKTLEEPPKNSLIILITSQIKRLFPTIISRCQRINFSALSPVSLEGILIKDYNFPADESRYLSFFCEGRLGKSLRFKNTNILREKNHSINDFLNFSGRGYFPEQIFEDKDKQRQLLIILLHWFRDIMLLKSGVGAANLINFDRKDDLLKLKEKYSFKELATALKDIIETHTLLEQNLNVKITLSLLRERLCKN